jgi:hypothetical protein
VKTLPIVAIDPGRHAGIAWFSDAELVGCCLVDPDIGLPLPLPDCAWEPHIAVIELPCHEHGDTPSRTNDLFKASFRAGRLVERCGARMVQTVSPHDWKGSVPKDLHNERVLKKLTVEEREIVYAACTQNGKRVSLGLLNNVIDAVGLGLWYIGR